MAITRGSLRNAFAELVNQLPGGEYTVEQFKCEIYWNDLSALRAGGKVQEEPTPTKTVCSAHMGDRPNMHDKLIEFQRGVQAKLDESGQIWAGRTLTAVTTLTSCKKI